MAVKTAKASSAAHAAGIFADMSLDGPEIGTLVAVIDRARHLPNRKTMGKQDPYCAMRLGKEAKKTETDKRGGQTPKWDQELRFNVHDSADYYRMKCSVFNDDKKTDLIGESWIDLKELIVSGGGQTDLWHQLHFKGKYAGEIRVEMTYYDSRPPDQAVIAKKQEKERRQQTQGACPTNAVTGPRQLGPREVKRRPLPASPAGSLQSTPTTTTTPDVHQPLPQSSRRPVKAATFDLPSRQPVQDDRYWEPKNDHDATPDFPDPIDSAMNYQQTRQPEYFSPDSVQPYTFEAEDPQVYNQQSITGDLHHGPRYSGDVYNAQVSSQQSNSMQMSNPTDLFSTPQSYHSHSSMQISSSPPTWSGHNSPINGPPLTANHPQYAQHRHSMSPTKPNLYRDSLLRQSLSQRDFPHELRFENVPEPEFDEPPPPPPPVHAPHASQPTPPSSRYKDWQPPTPSRPEETPPSRQWRQSSVDDRSPLQTIEYNYRQSDQITTSRTLQQRNQVPLQSSPHDSPYGDRISDDLNHYRRGSSHENLPSSHWEDRFDGPQRTEEPESYDFDMRRRSSGPRDSHGPVGSFENRGRNSYSGPPPPNEQIYRSEPEVYRPRAISPAARSIPPHKPVSPLSYSSQGLPGSGATPYGPDSFDALNPGSSSAVELNTTPIDTQEAARQREVEKLRDQGPIIGNDGRVIDPSDHLPADTWAPEPERKSRKPEVVIRFKTKEHTGRNIHTRSSPASARPLSTSSFPTSPINSTGSPSVSGTPLRMGPNELQKQTPNRPLPNQPFQHSHSSPAVSTRQNVVAEDSPRGIARPEFPPQSHYSTPSPGSVGMPARPQLSEYSISPGREYAGGSQRSPYDARRNGVDVSEALYDNSGFDYSSIDIGPSRYGRTAVRSSRGYGM